MTDAPSLPDQDEGLAELIGSHRPIVRRLFNNQQKTLDAFQHTQMSLPDAHVFHYTNDIGFHEIIKSGNLWMSDYTTLNDPSEIRYGLDVGILSLEDECKRRGSPPLLRSLARTFTTVASLETPNFVRAFVLSMCADSNDLTQWRSYGDNGRGYCLGFDTAILDHAFLKFSSSYKTSAGSFFVKYDSAELRYLLDTFSSNAAEAVMALDRATLSQTVAALSAISTNLLFAAILTALHFKHPAYKSEQEYRYIIVTAPTMKLQGTNHRARQHKLIDYLNFNWKQSHRSALRSITVGPAAGFDLTRSFVSDTMRLYFPAAPSPIIDRCNVPYRA